ncbi:hypothetical protein EDD86DRAFT_246391 [Gorgonomyces haynaldii]|nr:hypothetical protein EDD86DRAFT_246391 [Gorgonomyces haynaldii]
MEQKPTESIDGLTFSLERRVSGASRNSRTSLNQRPSDPQVPISNAIQMEVMGTTKKSPSEVVIVVESPLASPQPQPEETKAHNTSLSSVKPKVTISTDNIAERHVKMKPFLVEDEDDLLLYTRGARKPQVSSILFQPRFILRMIQFVASAVGFTGLVLRNFITNFRSDFEARSGSDLYVFVAITSVFVSLSDAFVYMFPGIVMTTPFRYHRTSLVENCLDWLMTAFWVAAPVKLWTHGKCPGDTIVLLPNGYQFLESTDGGVCPSWSVAIGFGILAAVAYLSSSVLGIKDIRRGQDDNPIMFARGNWLERDAE